MGLYQSAAGFAGGAFLSYQHGLETLDALFSIEPNEPMKYVEDINAHFSWPKNWS